LHKSSCLDNAYEIYRRAPQKPELMDITIYSPPVSKNQKVWGSEKWKVNFSTLLVTTGESTKEKNFSLKIAERVPIWYYKTQKSGLKPFPYKINLTIAESIQQKKPKVRFSIKEENGKFTRKKDIKYTFDINNKKMFLTGKPQEEFPVLLESEIERIQSWDHDFTCRENSSLLHLDKIQLTRPIVMDGIEELDKQDDEYKKVENAFFTTIPRSKGNKEINQIVSIKKYNHQKNKDSFRQKEREIIAKHPHNPGIVCSKLLWHGTNTPPIVFYMQGWKLNYACDGNLWGKGCYFSCDAAYSANYAEMLESGNKVLMLADTIVGQPIQCPESKYIVDVPQGYDSVLSVRHGTYNYVIYESGRALLVYSVEWKENK